MIGEQFGRLTVIGKLPRRGKNSRWLCQCACGVRRAVCAGNLANGHTKSCGCLSRELSKQRRTTHGLTSGRNIPTEFVIWAEMNARCHKPTQRMFKHYGARGIRVCEQWRHDFHAFLRDVGQRPSKQHSLDRIDNNGNYEPGNVRWATKIVQANNQRSNRVIQYNGESRTMAEWSRHYGVPYKTLHYRLQSGWATERAFTQPLRKWPGQ